MEFTPEMLEQLLSKAVASALATKKAKSTKERKPRTPMTEEKKAENKARVDAQTVVNFAAKGYKDIQPRVNVRTYDKWIEAGRRVRKGEKSTKCGSWPLFHILQTDAIMSDGKVERHTKSSVETQH